MPQPEMDLYEAIRTSDGVIFGYQLNCILAILRADKVVTYTLCFIRCLFD